MGCISLLKDGGYSSNRHVTSWLGLQMIFHLSEATVGAEKRLLVARTCWKVGCCMSQKFYDFF